MAEHSKKEIERILLESAKPPLHQQHADELNTFDIGELLIWDDKNLAKWQSRFKPDEPQWILADQEWKRRAGMPTRRIAIAAILVSVLSLLVAVLSYFHPANSTTAPRAKPLEQPTKQLQLPTPPQK